MTSSDQHFLDEIKALRDELRQWENPEDVCHEKCSWCHNPVGVRSIYFEEADGIFCNDDCKDEYVETYE